MPISRRPDSASSAERQARLALHLTRRSCARCSPSPRGTGTEAPSRFRRTPGSNHWPGSALWKVADGPTAMLMERFYGNLRNGQTKDEALRNAQVALIRMSRRAGVDYSSPAHWAAFTLTGDWK